MNEDNAPETKVPDLPKTDLEQTNLEQKDLNQKPVTLEKPILKNQDLIDKINKDYNFSNSEKQFLDQTIDSCTWLDKNIINQKTNQLFWRLKSLKIQNPDISNYDIILPIKNILLNPKLQDADIWKLETYASWLIQVEISKEKKLLTKASKAEATIENNKIEKSEQNEQKIALLKQKLASLQEKNTELKKDPALNDKFEEYKKTANLPTDIDEKIQSKLDEWAKDGLKIDKDDILFWFFIKDQIQTDESLQKLVWGDYLDNLTAIQNELGIDSIYPKMRIGGSQEKNYMTSTPPAPTLNNLNVTYKQIENVQKANKVELFDSKNIDIQDEIALALIPSYDPSNHSFTDSLKDLKDPIGNPIYPDDQIKNISQQMAQLYYLKNDEANRLPSNQNPDWANYKKWLSQDKINDDIAALTKSLTNLSKELISNQCNPTNEKLPMELYMKHLTDIIPDNDHFKINPNGMRYDPKYDRFELQAYLPNQKGEYDLQSSAVFYINWDGTMSIYWLNPSSEGWQKSLKYMESLIADNMPTWNDISKKSAQPDLNILAKRSANYSETMRAMWPLYKEAATEKWKWVLEQWDSDLARANIDHAMASQNLIYVLPTAMDWLTREWEMIPPSLVEARSQRKQRFSPQWSQNLDGRNVIDSTNDKAISDLAAIIWHTASQKSAAELRELNNQCNKLINQFYNHPADRFNNAKEPWIRTMYGENAKDPNSLAHSLMVATTWNWLDQELSLNKLKSLNNFVEWLNFDNEQKTLENFDSSIVSSPVYEQNIYNKVDHAWKYADKYYSKALKNIQWEADQAREMTHPTTV